MPALDTGSLFTPDVKDAPTVSTQGLTIRVRDIRVAADIGVFHHEIGRRQLLIISVTAQIEPMDEDTMEATLDYNRVVEFCETLSGQRINLIETFARRLADTCLNETPTMRVEVRITKPGALTNGTPEVWIERARIPRARA